VDEQQSSFLLFVHCSKVKSNGSNNNGMASLGAKLSLFETFKNLPTGS